jgi:4-hydroxy-tetrahydrodipicolinate reductase
VAAPVRIAVAGALGKMGRSLLKVGAADPQVKIVGAWQRPESSLLGKDSGELAGIGRLEVPLAGGPQEALFKSQVAIDFTSPTATLKLLPLALQMKRSLVIGTTGFEPKDFAQVKAAAKKIPIVLSSNYSVGVNLLWKALDMVARITRDDYDIEVIEAHHNAKKDSPSGTAMTTAEVLAKAVGRDLGTWARYGRAKGNIGARDFREIGLHTVRGGDIVGDHTVLFAGKGERLEFKHQAHSRDNFALGAVRAAKWLVQKKKKAGLYAMADVLGF